MPWQTQDSPLTIIGSALKVRPARVVVFAFISFRLSLLEKEDAVAEALLVLPAPL